MSDELDQIDESLIERAKELLQSSDVGLMAFSLGSNPDAKDNYQMAMALKFKHSLLGLKNEINKLRKSLNASSWVMGAMTLLILILTGVIVWRGFF